MDQRRPVIEAAWGRVCRPALRTRLGPARGCRLHPALLDPAQGEAYVARCTSLGLEVCCRVMIGKRDAQLMAFLRSVPIFHDLKPSSMGQLCEYLEEQVWDAGATIFSEGDSFRENDSGRRMYVLREGEVEVLRRSSAGRQVSMLRLGPGETFGEMALVELQPRSATLVARKRAKTYSLTNLDLFTLFRQDPNAYVFVVQNICRMLSRRLRKADSRIVDFLDGHAPRSTPPSRPSHPLSAKPTPPARPSRVPDGKVEAKSTARAGAKRTRARRRT